MVNPADDDALLAEELAAQAGALLLSVRSAARRAAQRADALADRYIGAELARRRPRDHVLSEESPDDPARLRCRRVWIIDPLDGTREYEEADRTDWAVHVALWADGRLSAAAVALPALGEVYSTRAGHLAGPPAERGPQRIAVSRTRPPPYAASVAGELGAELVDMGSAGAKVAAVLRGDVDAYLHDGGQHEWDSAAPVAVAAAAGLHASRADGSPLRYNQPNPWSPDLLVCRRDAAGQMVEAIDRHRERAMR